MLDVPTPRKRYSLQPWAKRIKYLREKDKLSKQGLADLMNTHWPRYTITRPAISMWETGAAQSLEAYNLLKVARVFGVDPYWIMFGKYK